MSSSVVIPQGTTVTEQRLIRFFVATAANPLAPQTTGVAGEKGDLSFGTGMFAPTENDIIAISAALGEYAVELSDGEVANDRGNHRFKLDLAGCAPVRETFQIGPETLMESELSKEDLAVEVLLTLAAARGHKIFESGTDIVVTDTDGVTELSRQPRVRAVSALNPVVSLG